MCCVLQTVEHFFDGKVFAHYLVSTGRFQHPITRAELTADECSALDSYLVRHKLGKPQVVHAFEHRHEYTTDVPTADNRLARMRAEATDILAALFAGGGDGGDGGGGGGEAPTTGGGRAGRGGASGAAANAASRAAAARAASGGGAGQAGSGGGGRGMQSTGGGLRVVDDETYTGAQAATASDAAPAASFPTLATAQHNWATSGHAAESDYQRTQRVAREMEKLLARRRAAADDVFAEDRLAAATGPVEKEDTDEEWDASDDVRALSHTHICFRSVF